MNAMLQETKNTAFLAEELGRLLSWHKGGDVIVMDMRSLNYWTDFFVIATITSSAHLSGLERHIKDYSAEKGLEHRRSRRNETQPGISSDEWCLIDLGDIVIHLMNEKSRSFYELERLWGSAPIQKFAAEGGVSGTGNFCP
ncbi:MAG: ribosome silencing factor [Treponema sp.]|nr:ribosome silencing factor [Treponema sp.]